jgi:hypothetical protein
MMIDEIMLVGNVICAVGTVMQIYAVFKNRNILRGYSPIGATITAASIIMFQVGFYLMGAVWSVVFGSVAAAFWSLVSFFTARHSLNRNVVTYLAGPIDRVSPEDASDWRRHITAELAKMGIKVLDPVMAEDGKNVMGNLDAWRKEGNAEKIRQFARKIFLHRDIDWVARASFMTVFLPDKNVEVCGAYGEITLAYTLKKPVYIITTRPLVPLEVPYWAVGISAEIFEDWQQYLNFVRGRWGKQQEK